MGPNGPAGPGGPRGLPRNMQQEKIRENLVEYDDMLSSLDFGASKHHWISLSRVKPEYDPLTGRRIAGYLEQFTRPVSLEEIRAKHGGGEYQLMLMGPTNPDGTGRKVIRSQKTIEISGEPLLQQTPSKAGSSTAKLVEDASQIALVKQVMESKERDSQRLWAEQQEMKKLLLQAMSKNEAGMKDVMATALSGGGDMRREMLEERRIQEERMRADREERQRELDRVAGERKRELEMAQVQHERQLEILRLQSEKQIEQMRLENQRILEEMRQRTVNEASGGRDLLLFMQKMDSEKAATVQRQQELFLMQQQKQQELATAQAAKQQEFLLQQQLQGQQMLLAQMTSVQQTKEQQQESFALQASKQQEFLIQQQMQGQQMLLAQLQSSQHDKEKFLFEMLKESRAKKQDDFFETMEKFQQVKSFLGGTSGGGEAEGDGKERWEKVLDRIGEAAPGIVAVASSFLQSRTAQNNEQRQVSTASQPAQLASPAPQRVLPGSVAVAEVDLPAPPSRLRLPSSSGPPPAAPLKKKKKKLSPEQLAARAQAKAQAQAQEQAQAQAQEQSKVETATLLNSVPNPEGTEINDLVDFVLPPQGMDMADGITLLVKNIDLAVQREYPAQRIYDEVVSKFPVEILTVLKLASADQMIEILEQKAPPTWIINSLVGSKRVEELHELLVES